MTFYSRFEELCSEKGLKPQSTKMQEITGVSSPAISNWKNKDSLPSADVLCRIAKYFSVSTDYLLGLSNVRFLASDAVLSEHEAYLLEIFREADPKGKFEIIHTCVEVQKDRQADMM